MLSDGDPVKEKALRRMDYYSFIQRIFTLQKKAKAEEDLAQREENRFGRQK
jgi:hypothetical protein